MWISITYCHCTVTLNCVLTTYLVLVIGISFLPQWWLQRFSYVAYKFLIGNWEWYLNFHVWYLKTVRLFISEGTNYKAAHNFKTLKKLYIWNNTMFYSVECTCFYWCIKISLSCSYKEGGLKCALKIIFSIMNYNQDCNQEGKRHILWALH